MHKKEKGLATILIAVMVLIILVLGFISGYYYFKNKDSKTTPVAPTTSTKTSSSPTASKTATSTSTPTAFNEVTAKQEACKAVFPNCKISVSEAKIDECFCQIDKITEKFAMGDYSTKVDESGGPGAVFIAAKVGSSWVLVQTTQDEWICAKLKEYSVPKDFVNTCYDESTGKATNY